MSNKAIKARDAAVRLRDEQAIRVLTIARALTIGAAYVTVRGIPGLTSSFVAIFVALLAFDIMVAAESIRPRKLDFRALVMKTRDALQQTVSSLAKGLSLGLIFGTLTLIGFSELLGSILTVGLGYTWAIRARRSFTGFVAVLGGLAIYEQIRVIEFAGDMSAWSLLVTTVAPVAWRVSSGTIVALLSGWFFGIPTGYITRLVLARPYRIRSSNAYDPPHEVRPFEEVIHAGGRFRVNQVKVQPDSAWVGRTLRDLHWRDQYEATVVAIERGSEHISLPRGSETILGGDALLIFCAVDQLQPLLDTAQPNLEGVTQ